MQQQYTTHVYSSQIDDAKLTSALRARISKHNTTNTKALFLEKDVILSADRLHPNWVAPS